MKKLTAILLTIVTLFVCVVGLAGCVRAMDLLKTYGDFQYYVEKSGNVMIYDFSDEGKEKEIIVVPKEIDGHKVGCYGEVGHGMFSIPIQSDKLKRIYFPDSSIGMNEDYAFRKCENLQCIFFVGTVENGEYIKLLNKLGWNLVSPLDKDCNVYVYYEIYELFKELDYDLRNTRPANVTYYYNHDGAPNDGYYWLDNYDYGEKIAYPPENPTCEGYDFDGWYTESECVSKWDFETSTLPAAVYDENGEEIYQETRLFARWIKE